MKETAEADLGIAANNAVVSVLAYFTDSQRQATTKDGLRRNSLGNECSPKHQRADRYCDRLCSRQLSYW